MISATDQMTEIMDSVYVETKQNAEKAIVEQAKETAAYLRQISPRQKRGIKNAGRYERGWTFEDAGSSSWVYNKTDWQLTHLLEDGHDVKNRWSGGRVLGHYDGVKHIEIAEQQAQRDLPLRISRGLK